jgi:hypothetical protein
MPFIALDRALSLPFFRAGIGTLEAFQVARRSQGQSLTPILIVSFVKYTLQSI